MKPLNCWCVGATNKRRIIAQQPAKQSRCRAAATTARASWDAATPSSSKRKAPRRRQRAAGAAAAGTESAAPARRRSPAEAFYDAVFKDAADAKRESRRERDERRWTRKQSFVYGEIEYASFEATLRKIRDELRPGQDVFYDLGSGAGRPVVAAAVLFPFRACRGVELLAGLSRLARDAKVLGGGGVDARPRAAGGRILRGRHHGSEISRLDGRRRRGPGQLDVESSTTTKSFLGDDAAVLARSR